jgi:hypothetical protein
LARTEDVLWIGGAQWAGKSTVARLLTVRHPLLRYSYDYHDARSHAARARADATRYPVFNRFLSALDRDPDSVWSLPSPEQMAEQTLAIFAERFQMVLDDIDALPGGIGNINSAGGSITSTDSPTFAPPTSICEIVPRA